MLAITRRPTSRPLPRRPGPPRRRVPKNPLSRAAVNERLYRERRRRGAIVIQRLVLTPPALDALIRLGWLREDDRGDLAKGSRTHWSVLPDRPYVARLSRSSFARVCRASATCPRGGVELDYLFSTGTWVHPSKLRDFNGLSIFPVRARTEAGARSAASQLSNWTRK
jgi:hypothetical protein